jgi:hypothetical protein
VTQENRAVFASVRAHSLPFAAVRGFSVLSGRTDSNRAWRLMWDEIARLDWAQVISGRLRFAQIGTLNGTLATVRQATKAVELAVERFAIRRLGARGWWRHTQERPIVR